MKIPERQPIVEVRCPADIAQLELRRGIADAQRVPRHWHEEYQFSLTQIGAGELQYRGQRLLTPPASLFVVHPGEVHSNLPEQSGVSYRMMLVGTGLMHRVAAEVYGKASALPFFPTTVIFDQALLRQYLALQLVLEQATTSLERQSLLLDLLAALMSRFAASRPASRTFGLERKVIRRACEYLAEHYAENVSLDYLAQIANLSPFHFNRVFAQQFGMPPHAYQTRLRITRAKALLRQGWAIPEVALQTGFADQSHLNRHFKRLVTVTPGQYRKNVQDRSSSRG